MTTSLSIGVLPSFVTVVCEVEIQKAAEIIWPIVGNFADAGKFLAVSSKIVGGDGGLGSVRQIGENILEVLTSKTAHSYGYAQTVGPMAPYSYHGFLELKSLGDARSLLRYTLIYDESKMDAVRKEAEGKRLSARFLGAAEQMKKAVG